jgi:Rrf2 family protein
MLGISEAVSLALHAMLVLANKPESRRSTRELAVAIGASEAHLAKVLGRLGRVGMVRSSRGPGGGSVLGRPAATVTLLEIYEAMEGPLATSGCLLPAPICHGQCCALGGLLASTQRTLHAHLAGTKLSELCSNRLGQPARASHGQPARGKRSK